MLKVKLNVIWRRGDHCMKRTNKVKVISHDDAVKILEIYPKTKVVYDYIKEHPNSDARVIANALGAQQVYTHVNRLEDYDLVNVQKQRERHYSVKHYTVNELTTERTSNIPTQQTSVSFVQKNAKTMMKGMTDESYKGLFTECLFDDLNEDLTKPDFRLNIGGVDCVSSGSIVAIAGRPGAGKSTAMAIIAGVMKSGNSFGPIGCGKKAERILWVDTEKDAFSCRQRMRIFRSVAGLDAEMSLKDQNLHFLRMSNKSTDERFLLLSKIEEECESTLQYNAIFIDGLFDLTDNPDKNFVPVIDLLRKLSAIGITVFAMLHTNKQVDDDNMRYALGTELQRICTNRFTVKYDEKKKLHQIIHQKSNDTAFAPTVCFAYDDNGDVVPVEEQRKENPKSIASRKDFETILSGGVLMTNKELESELMKLAKVKERAAQERIIQGCNKGIIEKTTDGKYFLKND